MKYEVAMTQAKSLIITVEADDRDAAIAKAKSSLGNPEEHFKNRIGAIVVAGVRELKNDGSSS